MLRIFSCCVVTLSAVWMSHSAAAFTITLDPGVNSSFIRADSSSSSLVDVVPTSVPESGSPMVSAGSESTTTAYDLLENGFFFDFTHARGTSNAAFAQSFARIYFSLDETVDYEISGNYSAVDSTGRRILLEIGLFDETAASTLYQSIQESNATANQSFTAGGMGGDTFNLLSGSDTGTLIPGNEYRLEISTFIMNSPAPVGVAATASGHVSLLLIPEPTSIAMVVSSLFCLVLKNPNRRTADSC